MRINNINSCYEVNSISPVCAIFDRQQNPQNYSNQQNKQTIPDNQQHLKDRLASGLCIDLFI